jgi:Uma2 family endonuclease
MAEVGILAPEERGELIEGEILVRPPIGPGHADNVDEFNEVLAQYAPGRFRARIQIPIRLNDGSEPEPDVALLRRRPEGYGAAHPTPADVLLVIEVADSSLEYDRQVKAHSYGRAGVPETWVRNLPENCIERFTEPGPEGYTQHTIHRPGETLTPVALPNLELAIAVLLPPPTAGENSPPLADKTLENPRTTTDNHEDFTPILTFPPEANVPPPSRGGDSWLLFS